ncbi:Ycf66 family protein [Kamptonema sp. UHCC 0994]|uniref:Ycf66 family protein n=1 Tax=Kamptonema sp. UHCC 0994 TaxID=3031329 RepID=UPI0023B93DB5|nr:Ycf66 family protein [Kamptonema sp. UHCC 0994]MDF0555437.1 Ycf66 family protein [Kamptonema sp. UHCC 0994]
MLAYILALAVGLGSCAVYMAAFFFPEVHRKSDFLWSGVGLFYALILWVCAGRITGAVLLGQIASVALLGWFGWQTLTLRRELTPVAQQTPIPNPDIAGKPTNLKGVGGLSQVPGQLTGLFGKKKDKIQKKPTIVRPPSSVESKDAPSTVVAKAPESVDVTSRDLEQVGSREDAIASSPKTETQPSVVPTADTISDATSLVEDVASQLIETGFATTPSEVKVEINIEATVYPDATPPNSDAFDAEDDFAESTQKPLPSASSTATTKTVKTSGGFGGLLANIKNSLGGLGSFGKGKSKPADTAKKAKPPKPESQIATSPTVDKLDDILDSNLVENVQEVAVEAPNAEPADTKAEEIAETPLAQTTPKPEDLISPRETNENPGLDTAAGQIQETERSLPEIPVVKNPEALTEAADALEADTPAPPVEIALSQSPPPAEPLGPGDPAERLEEGVSIEDLSAVPMEIASVEVPQAEVEGDLPLVRPNPPDPKLVEAAKKVDESNSKDSDDGVTN